VPLLGAIPLDPVLREGADSGVPLLLSDAGSPSALAIARVAEAIEQARRPGAVTMKPFAVVSG
jgi:ATP-binding protein involved in chromosome partitioning